MLKVQLRGLLAILLFIALAYVLKRYGHLEIAAFTVAAFLLYYLTAALPEIADGLERTETALLRLQVLAEASRDAAEADDSDM